ncbi:class II fructose-bisphosphatase [Roseovarius rhodophyticola]|uniref:Fructose-1,6-bisphosphatase n=1 Tax=Roseovarius rhodophyticola TaxID=3080827 RepID=A0ABZ2TDW4_9RHOB|nr:class II fructose-bisphosphatase [Roseovarius sp. W115]MDV2931037.1 class II fructose-bisphosphatase [Roseovarius sp. W115]
MTQDFDDATLSLALARVSEQAALACRPLIGHGDEKAADQAAVNAMREELGKMDIAGTVVIGEGERDEAPMLYIGEEVGSGTGPAVDIALDPLEGTTITAKAMPNALTVISMAPRGTMLHAPDVYMDKLAIGPGYPKDVVSLDMSPEERVTALAKAKGCAPSDITVCVLERPRHEDTIAALRSTGAAVYLIGDGDVAGVMHCTDPEATGIDMYMGSGGAPEGVLAAGALKCLGGQIWGRLLFRNDDERGRAAKAGITDLDRVYSRDELVSSDVIFAATGVTQGSLVAGLKPGAGYVETQTLLLRSSTGERRVMTCRHPVA